MTDANATNLPTPLPAPYYKVTITEYRKVLGEVGKQYKDTGRKNEDGSAIWDYTPSQIGIVSEERQLLVRTIDEPLDIPAIERVLNRRPKEVPPMK